MATKSLQSVIDLINETNPLTTAHPISETVVEFSNPETNTDSEIERNTKLDIAATPGGPYRNSTSVFYNRINLSAIPENSLEVYLNEDDTEADLLVALQNEYQLDIDEDDVTIANFAIPESGSEQEVILASRAGSYGFIGACVVRVLVGENLADQFRGTTYNGF